ncbi:MAG: histidinol-phosphate aminotransferase family protein [Chloroflexi bacterium]|nr:histidinol-phosphate aminotransferase family protein [Chloroflexota bacterium]
MHPRDRGGADRRRSAGGRARGRGEPLVTSADDTLDLASNLHPHGPHPAVVEAARRAELGRYPADTSTLAAEVALSVGVSREQVLITAGATEAVHLALRALLGPGDACTVFTPAFGEYERVAQGAGFTVERHEALPPGFAPPPDDPPRALLTVVANPSSPAGVYVDESVIRRVLRVARGVVLVDAVYEPFVEDAWDANKLVRDGLPVLVIHSFTKLHAIPGLRVGYVTGPAPRIGGLAALQPKWSVSSPAIEAAHAALPLDAERREVVGEVAETREAMHDFFASRGIAVSPSRANFVLAQTGDAPAMRAALLRRGIEVRDCTSFGLPDWVRIATPPAAELRRVLDALGGVLEELA